MPPKTTRPPLLTPSHTLPYKSLPARSVLSPHGPIELQASTLETDVYLPLLSPASRAAPVMLFIHGGGWTHSNRADYSRALLERFLALKYVVVSMSYRYCPETLFDGMCEDVRDIEGWLRRDLEPKIGLDVDGQRIVVVGASAGAHLALLKPKLWSIAPKAILSLYGPTKLHNLPYLNKGSKSLSNLRLPPCTPALLSAATDYAHPPSNYPYDEQRKELCPAARLHMGQHVYRGELLADFLLRGLVLGAGGLELPEQGSAGRERVDEISPIHLVEKYVFPPVYQLMGTNDSLFRLDQMYDFEREMQRQGHECVSVQVEGAEHGFDVGARAGDRVDVEVLGPAVGWVDARVWSG